MVTDAYKDEAYFQAFAAKIEERIRTGIAVRDSAEPGSRKYLNRQNFLQIDYMDYLKAKSSLQAPFAELREIARKYLDVLMPGGMYYDKAAEAMSLIIVYEIDTPAKEILLAYTEMQDHLLEGLKNYIRTGTFGSELPANEEFRPFDDYACGRMSLAEFVQYMEEKWYSDCEECTNSARDILPHA